MLVKRHNKQKQLSGASQSKFLKKKIAKIRKEKKCKVNESKFININEVVIDNNVRGDHSCVASKIS
jgi:predicted nucleic acid-binding protein